MFDFKFLTIYTITNGGKCKVGKKSKKQKPGAGKADFRSRVFTILNNHLFIKQKKDHDKISGLLISPKQMKLLSISDGSDARLVGPLTILTAELKIWIYLSFTYGKESSLFRHGSWAYLQVSALR